MTEIKTTKTRYPDYFISLFLLTVISSVAILYLYNIYQWRSAPFFGFGYREFSGWAVVGRVYEEGYKAGFRLKDRIYEVNGKPVENLASVRQLVNKKIGALNEFTIIRDGQKHTIFYRTSTFGLKRAALVFGTSWLIGIVIICIGSFIFYTTLKKERKWSFFLFCLCAGLIMIFFNQRSIWPDWLLIFWIIGLCFLPATILHMTFIFPFYQDYKPRHFIYAMVPYTISFLLFVKIKCLSLSFSESPRYLRIFILFYLFLSISIFIYTLIYKYRKIPFRVTKLKIRVVLFGFFIGVLVPLAEPIINSTFGIIILPNIEMATLPFITAFPLSIAYAIVKHDLFEIDIFIKRTAGYLLATASIALFYLLFVFNANLFLKAIFLQHPHMVNFLFILIVVFFFNPITNHIQIFVNRIFFRQRYDYKEPVKQLLKDITSIFDLDLIIRRVLHILSNTMFIENIRIFLYNTKEDLYFEYDSDRKRTINAPEKIIASSSPLVKLLLKEKKEITRDSFFDIQQFDPLGGEIFLLFESWNAQLILPFIMHKKLSGFLILGNIKSGRYYNKSDLEFLRIIADQTAIALENVNLIQAKIKKEKIEEELKIAGVIQRRMLPETAPMIKNISIYNQIIPSSEIGGDFYDFIEFPSQNEKEFGIIIGDISGHGISGALLMSAAHSICHNQAFYLKDVGSVMRAVNTLMIKETKKKAFVAMLYALLLSDGRIIISNAGLLPPMHYNYHNKQTHFLKNDGERLPIGIVEDLSYTPLTVSPGKGDIIFFYTDGIVEVQNQNKEIFGLSRLKELFSSLVYLEPEEIYNRIIERLEHFSGKKSFDDDLTILILKRTDAPPLDTIISLPSSSGNERIILQSIESLAQLFSFDDSETNRLKEEVNKIYKDVIRYYNSMNNCRLIVSLFPEGLNIKNILKSNLKKDEKGHDNINKNKKRKKKNKQVKIVDDRCLLELISKDDIPNCISNDCISRLIVNFL